MLLLKTMYFISENHVIWAWSEAMALMLAGFETPGWVAKRRRKNYSKSTSPRKKGDWWHV